MWNKCCYWPTLEIIFLMPPPPSDAPDIGLNWKIESEQFNKSNPKISISDVTQWQPGFSVVSADIWASIPLWWHFISAGNFNISHSKLESHPGTQKYFPLNLQDFSKLFCFKISLYNKEVTALEKQPCSCSKYLKSNVVCSAEAECSAELNYFYSIY